MKKLMVMGVLLLIPQMAAARVYMCVDPATGHTSFTDKACETPGDREEVRIDSTNRSGDARQRKSKRRNAWRSQIDTRKTGLDYNAERRSLYENQATASTE